MKQQGPCIASFLQYLCIFAVSMSVHLCMRKLCFDIPVHPVKYSALIVSTQLAGVQPQAANSTPQAAESQIVVSQAVDLTCGISLKP